jgi:hypothetical protein
VSIEPADLWRGTDVAEHGSAAVGSAVVLLAAASDDRRHLLVESLGAGTLFVGTASGMASGDGTAVGPSGSIPYDEYTGPVFGVADGDVDVRLRSIGAPLQAE